MPLVKSSHLRSVIHNNKQEKMRIRFWNGSIYEYSNVDRDEYDAQISAISKGKHFWKNIRQDKKTEQLKEGRNVKRRKK
jgi:hypothetical protein